MDEIINDAEDEATVSLFVFRIILQDSIYLLNVLSPVKTAQIIKVSIYDDEN